MNARLLACALLLGACRPSSAPAPSPSLDPARPLPDPLPEIAARVNGQNIPARSVRLLAEEALASGRVGPDQRPAAYRGALEQLIERELLLQEAFARGVRADDRAVDRAFDEARVAFKQDEDWAEYHAAKGMSPNTFRAELRAQHTVNALLAAEALAASEPSEAELRALVRDDPGVLATGERVRLSRIHVRLPAGAPPQQRLELRERAQALLRRVRSGEDFAAVARAASQDPASAAAGGELEVASRDELPPGLAELAFSAPLGVASEVYETPAGFEIVKLHERLPSVAQTLDDARERLKRKLLAQRRQAAIDGLVERLRARARIERLL